MEVNMKTVFSVVEIFKSIEGEGIRMGIPTTFVRFNGCNLKCTYCDSKYANGLEFTCMSSEEIFHQITKLGLDDITFTGGEPLISGLDFILWFINIMNGEVRINIETNGSIDIKPVINKVGTFVTMDYKSLSSGQSLKMRDKNLELLREQDVLKFVVADKYDLDQLVKVLLTYKPPCHIFVNPIFNTISLMELANFVLDHSYLNLRMGIQLQKVIWPINMRGV
jgi:7-carboxy-7-deazaguanine synthase